MKIAINSQTAGKYKREMINNREHIVTQIRPIRGDTAMNRIYYPLNEVKASFTQLDNIPAPNRHPTINGKHVSAFHPLATNAHNVGGMIRSPRMKNDEVMAELVLDVTVANQSDDGKELVRRIENGEKVGVSTGLNIANIIKQNGKDKFGQEYDNIGRGYQFDHVAILLNEQAAGEHAGTELVLNSAGEGLVNLDDDVVYVVNASMREIREQLEDLVKTSITGENIYSHVWDFWPDEKYFIYETCGPSTPERYFRQSYSVTDQGVQLEGQPVEVVKQVTWATVSAEPTTMQTNDDKGHDDMDKAKLVLSLIANSSTRFTEADQARLEAMSESALAAEVVGAVNAKPSDDDAKQVMTNAGFDFAAYDKFKANEAAFNEFLAAQDAKKAELVKTITTNSEYTDEMLKDKPLAEIELLAKTVTNNVQPDRSGLPVGARSRQVSNSADSEHVSVSFDMGA